MIKVASPIRIAAATAHLKIGGRVVYRLADVEAFESANLHANTFGPIDKRTEEKPANGIR